jgi:uncharacterized protein YbjT (DUF2867 family)
MQKPVVLVCGAAGNTGRAVVESLLQQSRGSVEVRAAVRSLDKGRDLEKKGAVLVQMDFADGESVRKALQGVDRLWVAPPNPSKSSKPYERAALAVNVMDEAKAAGVSFILLGSALYSDEELVLFHREFRLAERHLVPLGVSYCVLRMSMFMENIVLFKAPLRSGTLPQPLGQGRFSPVSVGDIGRMAASILQHYERHSHSYYAITGPQALSGDDMSAALSRVLGRDIRYIAANDDDAFKLLQDSGMPEWQIKGLIELYKLFRDNVVKPDPSPDYKKVTGQTGTDFETAMRALRTAGVLDV